MVPSSSVPEWHAASEYERRVEPFTSSFVKELISPLRFDFRKSGDSRGGDGGVGNGPRAKPRLLDVGCGSGMGSSLARDMGFDVTACDASPQMIDRVAARFPLIPAMCLDGHNLPFESEFDFVMGVFSVIFFRDPRDGLENIRNALVDDGGVVAISAWGNPDETPAFQIFPDAVKSTKSIPDELRGAHGRSIRITGSPEKLKTLLMEAGFENVSVKGPIQRDIDVPSAEEFYNRFALTSPNTMKLLEKLNEEQTRQLKSKVMQLATERTTSTDGRISIPSSCYFAYGMKNGT